MGKHYEHEVERGVEELSPLARMMGKVGFESASPQILLERFLQKEGSDSATSSSISSLKQQVRRMNLQALKTWLPEKWILIHGLQVTFKLKRSLTRRFNLILPTGQNRHASADGCLP